MNLQIHTAIKRARAYWFVDGFTEIAMGGVFILLAGFLLISMKTSQAPFPTWLLSITGEITILKMVSFLVVVLILWWLKGHFTYPRTGFVRGKITVPQLLVIIRNLILFLLLPIIGLLIAALLISSTARVLSSMSVWFPIGLGLVWAVLIVFAGEWMGLDRFRFIGGTVLLTGIGIGIWQLTSGLPNIPTNLQPEISQPAVLESINRALISLGILILIVGAIWMLSGILTFIRYRRENPKPYTEDV